MMASYFDRMSIIKLTDIKARKTRGRRLGPYTLALHELAHRIQISDYADTSGPLDEHPLFERVRYVADTLPGEGEAYRALRNLVNYIHSSAYISSKGSEARRARAYLNARKALYD